MLSNACFVLSAVVLTGAASWVFGYFRGHQDSLKECAMPKRRKDATGHGWVEDFPLGKHSE